MKQDDTFSKFLLYSFGFHLAIIIVLTVRLVFFSSEALDYQRSVRVDVVALPEKIKTQIPIAEKKEKPKPEVKKEEPKKPKKKTEPKKPKPPKKPIKKQPKKEQSSALARLKAMKKLKDQQKKQETQKVEYKGNEISKGNALEGLQKLQYDSYLGKLDGHIKHHWNLPEWLADDTLRATVLLLINKDGSIRLKRFISPSGNGNFDEHVMGTIDKASPFPPPPKDLVDFFVSKGLEVRFPE